MSFFQKINGGMKKINFLVLFIELALLLVLGYSVWQIALYYQEGKSEKDFNEDLADSAVSEISTEDDFDYSEETISQIVPFEGFEPEKSNILVYPDIKVDLNQVKKKYSKVVGWLYCPGTPINYPVVQGNDNSYFVSHMPNGAENAAGSIFMDYRDSASLTDFSHILYGHNMKNDSMFGTILNYKKSGYFEEHPFMFYFTEEKIYRLEVFAGVNTIATSSIYSEPSNKEAFISGAFSGSTFRSNISVSPEDRVLLMSTCSGAVGQSNRYVLFTKLVEIQ